MYNYIAPKGHPEYRQGPEPLLTNDRSNSPDRATECCYLLLSAAPTGLCSTLLFYRDFIPACALNTPSGFSPACGLFRHSCVPPVASGRAERGLTCDI